MNTSITLKALLDTLLLSVLLLSNVQASQFSNHNTSSLDYLISTLQDPLVQNLLKVPTAVLVGPQSVGKGLLISQVVGYRVSYSDPSMGTRCPVRYMLRNASEEKFETFKVGGNPVERHQIADKVVEHMKYLDLSVGFSVDTLDVEIFEVNSLPVNIIDLPGFPDVNQNNYGLVKHLIQQTIAAQQADAILIGIMHAGHPEAAIYGSSGFHNILDPVRPNWRQEIIVIKNFVNMALSFMHSAQNVRNYFRQRPRDFKEQYYVMLNPFNTDIHAMSFDNYSLWLKDVKSNAERKKFLFEIDRIESRYGGEFGSKDIYRTFGIELALDALQAKLQSMTLGQIPIIYEELTSQLGRVREDVEEFESELAGFNPDSVHRLYFEFITDLFAVLSSVLDDTFLPEDFILDPVDFTQTFEEELKLAHLHKNDSFDGLLTFAELKTIKQLDKVLCGRAAKHRLLMVFAFMLLNAPLPNIDDDGDFKNLVQNSLHNTAHMMDWLCNHLEYLLRHHLSVASKMLMTTKKYSGLKWHLFLLHENISSLLLDERRSAHIRQSLKNSVYDVASTVTSIDVLGSYDRSITASTKTNDIADVLGMDTHIGSPSDEIVLPQDMHKAAERYFFVMKAELYQYVEHIVQFHFKISNKQKMIDLTKRIAHLVSAISDEDLRLSIGHASEHIQYLHDKINTSQKLEERLVIAREKLKMFIKQNVEEKVEEGEGEEEEEKNVGTEDDDNSDHCVKKSGLTGLDPGEISGKPVTVPEVYGEGIDASNVDSDGSGGANVGSVDSVDSDKAVGGSGPWWSWWCDMVSSLLVVVYG